ncbi:hypothetical protein ACT2FY_12910 [Paraburkholderia fungorum]|uniref:hypothetical protein n=1 Tax=Paraburkholderia fungorum TaxID=134537 RepID=UPI00402BBC45
MTSLQKVNLGTAPAGTDGDPVRTAFTKANSNVDVLTAQSALTSAAQLVNSAQALTAALHLGRRVNISLASAGTVQVPAANTCSVDGVMLLRNIGATVVTLAITTGSGDTISLSKLNPGETALMDTDGVHAWTVLMRGRTNSDNEVVNGNCAVNGNETVGGTLSVTGGSLLASAAVTGNATVGGTLGVTGNTTVGGTLGVTGASTFSVRPTFASKTPWDSGNFNPLAAQRLSVGGGAVNLPGPGTMIWVLSQNFVVPANGLGVAVAIGTTNIYAGTAVLQSDVQVVMRIFDNAANAQVTVGPTTEVGLQAGARGNIASLTCSAMASGLTPGKTYSAQIGVQLTASTGVSPTQAGVVGIELVNF